MKIICTCLLLLFSASIASSQNEDRLISADGFDEDLLNGFLLDSVNKIRLNSKLPQLQFHEILDAAAYAQAEYLVKESSLSHQQSNKKFKSLEDRVYYFGGRFHALGENIAILYLNEESKSRRRSDQLAVRSYMDAVATAINSWLEKDESKLNIHDADFYRVGISSILDPEEQKMIIVLLFGTENYEMPGMDVQDDKGLKAFDKNKCANFLKEFPQIQELFSSSVRVENHTAYLVSNNAAQLRQIIKDNSDALAADILCSSQFDCNEGNQIFPGNVHEGYLLRPVSKSNVHSDLSAGHKKVNLGSIPPFYDDKNCEINLKIIKDNVLCETVPHNNFAGKNISWLSASMALKEIQHSNSIFTWSDSLLYKINLSEQSIERLDSMLTYNAFVNTIVERAEIQLSLSPVHALNEEEISDLRYLVEEKLREYNPAITISFKQISNWKKYRDFSENRVYSLETKEMDSLQIIEYLKEESADDKKLHHFLNSLNYFELHLKTKHIIDSANYKDQLMKLYYFFVKEEKSLPAVYLQQIILNEGSEMQKEKILSDELPRKKVFLDLINNQLVTRHIRQPEQDVNGKTVDQYFLELHSIDPDHKEVLYNLLYLQLFEWSKNLKNVVDPEEWYRKFSQLQNSKIADSSLNTLLLNYWILAADYYYENANFREREDAMKNVYSLLRNKKLNEEQANFFAEYFMFQLQLPWAVNLLKTFALADNPDERTLENILSISIYDEILKDERFNLYKKYSELYPAKFCQLFQKDKMGFQQLKEAEIKGLYCSVCEN